MPVAEVLNRSALFKQYAIRAFKEERGCPCGEKRAPCLDLHHRDGATKNERVRSGVSLVALSWEDLVDELGKCDVVCSNCHRAEDHRNGYSVTELRDHLAEAGWISKKMVTAFVALGVEFPWEIREARDGRFFALRPCSKGHPASERNASGDCRVCRREDQEKYLSKPGNREKDRARVRKSYTDNPEAKAKRRAAAKAWREANRERVRAYKKKYAARSKP